MPSSPSPAWSGSTSTAGSSPAACEAASESTPSRERAQLHPDAGDVVARAGGVGAVRAIALGGDDARRPQLRVDPRGPLLLGRRRAARCARSSLARPASTRSTSLQPATVASAAAGTAARIAPCAARRSGRSRRACAAARTRSASGVAHRMSTSVVDRAASRAARPPAGSRACAPPATASRLIFCSAAICSPGSAPRARPVPPSPVRRSPERSPPPHRTRMAAPLPVSGALPRPPRRKVHSGQP